jgi:hypothetical protein
MVRGPQTNSFYLEKKRNCLISEMNLLLYQFYADDVSVLGENLDNINKHRNFN